MRDFIIQCLHDLESLTGIRQLFFLESREDGKEQVQKVIAGILHTCKRYSYIPEDAQQRIISQMMMEDQDYEALNGRVVSKWLEANKGHWYNTTPKISEEELMPAPPEVADKYLAEWKEAVSKIGGPKTEPFALFTAQTGGSVIKELNRQKFIVEHDGEKFEVWATDEADAQKQLNETFK